MKKLILIFTLIILVGCSNDNCQDNKDAINKKFDDQIEHVKNNPGPNGVDYRQISLLNDERDSKLEQDCN